MTTYVGTFPNGYFVFGWKEQRARQGLTAAAYETSCLSINDVPEACGSSNPYTDGEVMVVSRTPTADD